MSSIKIISTQNKIICGLQNFIKVFKTWIVRVYIHFIFIYTFKKFVFKVFIKQKKIIQNIYTFYSKSVYLVKSITTFIQNLSIYNRNVKYVVTFSLIKI